MRAYGRSVELWAMRPRSYHMEQIVQEFVDDQLMHNRPIVDVDLQIFYQTVLSEPLRGT